LRSALPIGLATVVITMAAFFRVPLLPDIGDDLSMTAADLGMLTTVFALGRLVTDIPAGRMADRFHVGRMMANSAMLVGLGSLTLALAPVSLVAYLAAFVLGLGSALTNTTGMTYFSSATTADRRGASVSIFAAGLLVGQAIGPTLGGFMASVFDWRFAEVAAGVIAVAAAGALVSFGRRPAGSGGATPGPTPGISAAAGRPAIRFRYRALLYLVPFAMFASLGALSQTLIPIIGDDDLGLSPGSIGLALGVGGLFRLIGSIVGGQVADRVSRKSALVPGLLGSAFGVALLAVGSSTVFWLTSIMVMSVSSLGIGVAATMLADLSHGSGVGRRLGPFRFAGDVGLVLSPVIVARVFESFGTGAAVLPVAGLLAATGLAVAFFLPETRWLEEGAQR
jgi:DHA1 family multidrug resistance protein-like MFS transporter